MPTITKGVEFAHVAREWRCKWSEDGDKASLQACQEVLNSVADELKAIKGCVGVTRTVCGTFVPRARAAYAKLCPLMGSGATFMTKSMDMRGGLPVPSCLPSL